MNMKSRLALIAVAGFVITGCAAGSDGGVGGGSGGSGGSGGGSASKFCSADSQCKSGQICHPSAKVCVKTCTAGSDCPSGAKTCDLPPSELTGPKVCNCSTNALCAADTAGTVCSAFDTLCTAKCTANSDCPATRACNTTTGQCLAPGSNDGGTGGGSGGGAGGGGGGAGGGSASCTLGSCSGGQICYFVTNTCQTPQSCSTTATPQPDSCGYGGNCNAGTCAEIVPGTCANFVAGSNPLAWDPSMLSSNGPVIYGLSKVSFGNDVAFCGLADGGLGPTPVRAKIHVRAYSEMAVLVSETNQPAFHYVRTDHSELTLGATSIQNYKSDGGSRQADFDINLCAPVGTTSLTTGFYYTNGNAACFTAN